MTVRQQVLVRHLASKDLDSATVAWALYDGAAPAAAPPMRTGDSATPPYPSVLAALRAGWRLLQVCEPVVIPGREHATFMLPFEFILTNEADCDA